MKKYSESSYEDRNVVLTQWYEGSFSYLMRNLEEYVNYIFDFGEVTSAIENEVEVTVDNCSEEIDNETYGWNIVIDDVDMFKNDMVDFLMGMYEEIYLDED